MLLKTLGQLELEGTRFTRVKPMVLLAYLAIEGVKERRFLAELFWADASDSLNSLSRALSQLRKGAEGAIEADEHRVWTQVPADSKQFLTAIKSKNFELALETYEGAFLQGAHLLDWGLELEEWIYEKREELASFAQRALLEQAELHATRGNFDDAAELVERAYTLEGANPPEPEDLGRYFELLTAARHPLAAKIKEEAESFGIKLRLKADEAQTRLQSTFIGRETERARLESLTTGQIAWIKAPSGMGKTSLLKSLNGTYLAGRSGLPYATLEPLLGESLEHNEELMLRELASLEGRFLFDPWEWMDQESQDLLKRLADLRPKSTIIIASQEEPGLKIDVQIDLRPLSQEALMPFENAWALTEGLPILVGAYLRNEPLESALETRLNSLGDISETLYLALTLLEEPNLALVRRALHLKANEMASAIELLSTNGLIDLSGKVKARQAAQDYLEKHPLQLSELAIQLARQLKGLDAFPLYERSSLFWEEDDLPQVQEAYITWANELLRRGFPQRASETLADAPQSDEVRYLRARALERAGLFKESLEELENLTGTPDIQALKGALYWRLGQPDRAKMLSENALDGEMEARAEAFNTLGHLARSEGNFLEAANLARRSAALWKSLGRNTRWADALNSLAVAMALAGEESQEPFSDALKAAGENLLMQARIIANQGMINEREGKFSDAKQAYQTSAELAEKAGGIETSALAWNNLGVLHHKQKQKEQAQMAYDKALLLAQQAGERRLLGMFMANLAELNEDIAAWNEALHILETSGHSEEAKQYRMDLPEDHPFKLHSNGSN
ncbi:MAG: hypothetical protein KC422_01345 [Trueperaceae bacterium]|nr:hypothetical protein [Trueperaceae bacterium]